MEHAENTDFNEELENTEKPEETQPNVTRETFTVVPEPEPEPEKKQRKVRQKVSKVKIDSDMGQNVPLDVSAEFRAAMKESLKLPVKTLLALESNLLAKRYSQDVAKSPTAQEVDAHVEPIATLITLWVPAGSLKPEHVALAQLVLVQMSFVASRSNLLK